MTEQIQRVVFTAPGTVEVESVPMEAPGEHEILVKTIRSLISSGTELTSLLGERQSRSIFPKYPGYANVGTVVAVGDKVQAPRVGQCIASMGRHASHFLLDLNPIRSGGPQYWEPVPEGVSAEAASFAVLGSVALHGIRKAQIQLGQSAVVIGAGVVGQLTTQFASWSGCQPVIMLDLFDERLALAGQSGADFTINPHAVDPVAAVMEYTGGLGADLIFEGTRSSQTLPMMMKMAAQSARLMVVGSLTGTVEIDPFTELQLKELEIIGCYQPAAPTEGHAYFPWTQQRNRQITLKMLQGGKLKIDHLITHRMPFQAAAETYELIRSQGQKCLGVVFEW